MIFRVYSLVSCQVWLFVAGARWTNIERRPEGINEYSYYSQNGTDGKVSGEEYFLPQLRNNFKAWPLSVCSIILRKMLDAVSLGFTLFSLVYLFSQCRFKPGFQEHNWKSPDCRYFSIYFCCRSWRAWVEFLSWCCWNCLSNIMSFSAKLFLQS